MTAPDLDARTDAAPETPTYGRKLDDFEVGARYAHPWRVTLDEGLVARCQASFLDGCPTYASVVAARRLGFDLRPVHPLILTNLALSFSVHDVSEQAIAHLGYVSVHFPEAAFAANPAYGTGEDQRAMTQEARSTVRAYSEVLDVRRASSGDRGVVHVRTILTNEHRQALAVLERRALVPGGRIAGRPASAPSVRPAKVPSRPWPKQLKDPPKAPSSAFPFYFEDLAPGRTFAHGTGRTVGDSEHMELTTLFRNTHPLHVDDVYAKSGGSFAAARVVYGGLVLAWVHALASRDLGGNALWYSAFADGAHPAPVLAGDTLYAASRVLSARELSRRHGEVTLRLVGVKNMTAADALRAHPDLFEAELGKADARRTPAKVVEVTHRLIVWRRPKG